MRKIGTGIIGCGSISGTHAKALAELGESNFVAVCDVVEEKARALAEKWDVELVYTDSRKMLADPEVEAVLICTPHPSHAPLVTQSAEAGVHAMCEKPMTVDLKSADAMIEASRKAGIKFGVIFQRRWFEATQRLKKAIDEGKFGKLVLGDCSVKIWRDRDYFNLDPWRGRWDTEGGGVLVNQAVHYLDIFQWFMGPVDILYGLWDNLSHPYVRVDDNAVAVVRFKSGALGTILATSSTHPALEVKIGVHGDNGAAADVILEGPKTNTNQIWTVEGDEELAKDYAQQDASTHGRPDYHCRQIEDFLRAIIEDRDPAVTGEEGRKSVEMFVAIYRSRETGMPVKFPLKA